MTLGSHQTSIGRTQVHITPRWIIEVLGCCTALLHARTDWFEPIWESATAILFMADRLSFYRPDGTRQPANSGAPAATTSTRQRNEERYER